MGSSGMNLIKSGTSGGGTGGKPWVGGKPDGVVRRGGWVQFARTMVWVMPLTLLIWVYAEREQKTVVNDVRVRLEMRSDDPGRVVSMTYPGDRTVSVSLEGPRARVDRVRSLLSGGEGHVVPLGPGVPLGESRLSTATVVSDLNVLSTNGVTATVASPSEIVVSVDSRVTVEAVVMAPPELTGLQGPPAFTPSVVNLTGPAAVLGSIRERDATGKPVVYAQLDRFEQLQLPAVAPVELSAVPVALDVPNAMVTITPPAVSAKVSLRQPDVRLTLPAVPVFPLASMNLLDDYRAEFAPTLANVTVTGSADRIAALRQAMVPGAAGGGGSASASGGAGGGGTGTGAGSAAGAGGGPVVRALLSLSRDDLPEGQVRRKRVTYMLPDGITITAEDAAREVEFKLIKRTATGIAVP